MQPVLCTIPGSHKPLIKIGCSSTSRGHLAENDVRNVGDSQGKDDQAGTWGDLLSPQYHRIMLLAAGLPLFQQGSGINTVIYYSSQVNAFSRCLPLRFLLGL